MIETMHLDDLQTSVAATLNVPYAWVPDHYGQGAHALHMHILYPQDAPQEGLPVLLWICGGGWEVCEPANRLADFGLFASRGYIVCLVEYRISNTAPFPAQIIDVKTAIRFVRKHAKQFRADPNRIALMGDSAGGHLVTLAGLTPDKSEFVSEQWSGVSDAVQAVVNWYGVVDFYGMAQAFGLEDLSQIPGNNCIYKLFEGDLDKKADLIALATPMNYLAPAAPPFLILHGDQDGLVPLQQSRALHDGLNACGVPATLVIVQGAGHATPHFSQPKLLKRIADWLDATL